jgi:metal-dependent amidase/aminoacylase/carboxypeptidase family protein
MSPTPSRPCDRTAGLSHRFLEEATMKSEDFAFHIAAVPAAIAWIGARNAVDATHALHQLRFAIDVAVIELLLRTATELLGHPPDR